MNELKSESSPYLQQHKNNPVHWKAWSEKTLQSAQDQNKPLLISIGYSSCHWCHVMEEESFEDTEVAMIMNREFVNIKVDREERPDIDQIYMTAASIITGRGGWPLNCFAFPDGRPFHAGTYYPKEGWKGLLLNVVDQYENNTEKLNEYADNLTKGIRLQETLITDARESELDFRKLQAALEQWKPSWDMNKGGRKVAPKFPMPVYYQYLINLNKVAPDKETETFIHTSLTSMACGGIYDQIEGGFSRYSVDDEWKIPHFEKMLYDNAQLLSVYSLAYRLSPEPLYADVLYGINNWLQGNMKDPSGLYYSAMDADSEGVEGKYYTWTIEELKAVLSSDYERASEYFKLNGDSLWEEDRHILRRASGKSASEVQNILKKLTDIRSARPKPQIDDKCLCSWNGLLLEGFCHAYRASIDPIFKDNAIKLANAMIGNLYLDGFLSHQWMPGAEAKPAMLDDYCFMSGGLLEAFQISGNQLYYRLSVELIEKSIKHFYSDKKGVFQYSGDPGLISTTVEIYDQVLPSTNAYMARLLNVLGQLEANAEWISLSASMTGKVQQLIVDHPGAMTYWSLVHLTHTAPYFEIVVVGKDAVSLAEELMSTELPPHVLVYSDSPGDLSPFQNRFVEDKTLIYLCTKGTCLQAVESTADLLNLINQSIKSH